MKTVLPQHERQPLIQNIRSVLETGIPWEDKELHHPVGAIVHAILTIDGITKTTDFNSNGWQWDWWQHFVYKGQTYTLSGSGYHGGLAFRLSDGREEL